MACFFTEQYSLKVNETLSNIAYKNLIELPRMIKCIFGKRYFFFSMGIA